MAKPMKLSPFQALIVDMLINNDDITLENVKRKCKCSVMKAGELIEWLEKFHVIRAEKPREINVKQLIHLRKKIKGES